MANNIIIDEILKLTPLLSIALTVLGWIISSHLSGRNTFKNSKNTELNRLIDSLYKSLDDIYSEMLQLVTKENDEHTKTIAYHKMISSIQNIKFLASTINKIDHCQYITDSLLSELRQACTDDRKYSPAKIGIVLPEIRDIQERIKNNFNKKFN